MPKLGSEGGPQFKHFLTGTKSEPKTWNPTPTQLQDYKNGCKNSAGTDASFCTRVDIPHREYSGSMRMKCERTEKEIPNVEQSTVTVADPKDPDKTITVGGPMPPPNKIYADKAVQVSCDPNWVATVRSYLNREKAALNNTGGMASPATLAKETTLDMAISALEVDDEFLAAEGKWQQNPIEGEAGPHPLITEYQKITKIPDASSVADGIVTYQGEVWKYGEKEPKKKTVSVWKLVPLDRPVETEKYVSETCAYFTYHQPANASQCNFNYKTKDEANYVCRNHDGCFDESTLIRMADGSDRLVTQLKRGEFVYNPITKKPARIVKLTMGPELKPLIHVGVAGRIVKVTDTHPFMTRRGWIQAKALKATDEILSGQKHYLPVTSVSIGATGRTVANLALEGPADQTDLHYVLADGVVTGDLVIQNMLELKASTK
jgi:hypothetical protein